MDPYRLPRSVVPSRYDLRLEPDLTTLTFRGEETIAVTVDEPPSARSSSTPSSSRSTRPVVVDGSRPPAAGHRHARRGDRALPARLRRAARRRGPARCDSPFAGTLNDKLRGFYRSGLQGRRRGVTRTTGGHAVRGHRRPPRLPLLGRAGLQGRLRHHAGHRPGARRPSPTRAIIAETPRAAARSSLRRHHPDVDLPRGVRRRRAGGDRAGDGRRDAAARLVRAGQAAAGRVRPGDRRVPR